MMRPMFTGFSETEIATPRGPVHARVGGDGPPLLLLHGFPQSHLMWHPVAPGLAERFTVVAADLPGYGDSFRPPAIQKPSGSPSISRSGSGAGCARNVQCQ